MPTEKSRQTARHRKIVAVFAPSFPPAYRGGGPARTLEALTQSAPTRSFTTYVFTSDRDAGTPEQMTVEPNVWSKLGGTNVYYSSDNRIAQLLKMYHQTRLLRPEIIYLNSLFNSRFSVYPMLLGSLGYWKGAQFLIAPRGELDPGALAIKSRKKRLFLRIVQRLPAYRRALWHASSAMEETAIRKALTFPAKTLIRENETSLPDTPLEPQQHNGALRAVFVSRLSPKKGLSTALRSLAQVTQPIVFDVYGPKEDPAYIAECKLLAQSLPSNIEANYRGETKPSEVRALFATYDLFIFPTAGENFGHVIAEALSASCAPMVSDTTPWSRLLETRVGTLVKTHDAKEWTDSINQIAALNPQERVQLKQNAQSAYKEWRQATKAAGEHIFELATKQMEQ